MSKQWISVLVTLAMVLGLSTMAQATDGYQLIGVGGYQKSMGGAVTSNPGSAMTAIKNPAGMARIGSRADFSMELFMPDRSTDFTSLGGADVSSDAELYGIPAIGWTAPTGVSHPNLYFGGGMYGTSGLGVDYARSPMSAAVPPGTPGFPPSGMPALNWQGYSAIAFWQMAPTIAWAPNDRWSWGLAANFDYQQVAFKQQMTLDDGSPFQNFDLSQASSALGLGATVGVLYDVTPKITMGAAYKTKQVFSDLDFNLGIGDIGQTDPGTGTYMAMPAGMYHMSLDYPQQASFGVTVRPVPRLELSADVTWINWSSTLGELDVTGPGGIVVAMDPMWEDQTVFCVGMDFSASDRLSLRAGYNHGVSPVENDVVSRNLILPGVVEDHLAGGFEWDLNQNWQVGGHFMAALENTENAPANDPMAPGVGITLSETSAGLNLGYRF